MLRRWWDILRGRRWSTRWPLASKLWVSRLVYLHEQDKHPTISVSLTADQHIHLALTDAVRRSAGRRGRP